LPPRVAITLASLPLPALLSLMPSARRLDLAVPQHCNHVIGEIPPVTG
jgi:hypothetical protein